NLMGHAVGWPSPAGGAERLTEALVGYLRELGGQVRTEASVGVIEAAHGRVTGVRIAGERGRDAVGVRIAGERGRDAVGVRIAGERGRDAVGVRKAGERGGDAAGGERLAADVIIATVMPHALAALAGQALAAPYRALLRRYRYGPATVKVD